MLMLMTHERTHPNLHQSLVKEKVKDEGNCSFPVLITQYDSGGDLSKSSRVSARRFRQKSVQHGAHVCEHTRVGPLTNPNVVSHCPVLA